ncbi:hypothetical protein ACYRFS_00465 [Listeria kieliensis]|uniref:Type II secretion system protein n=1 Tax=Listeria kieliensis TaxID=1621700 RepID=A0A3D8TVK0_9LIST|nr:type II secretion system protein [Listeria kieliensis]RDX02912.1 hypothetical protein UR08_05285 [Listeria kieliensis]
MKKINGFSLIESILSLSTLLIICTVLFPFLWNLINRLDNEREQTMLYQKMYDEVKLFSGHPIKIHSRNEEIEIKASKGGWIICGKRKQQVCLPF